jgi:chromosome segregation ATPase
MSEEKEDANKIAKVRWSELSEMQIDKLRQENKSLESRLSEMEGFKNTFRDDANGWMKACDSLKNDIKLSREKNRDLESRLNEAESALEAERSYNQNLSDELKEPESRLSTVEKESSFHRESAEIFTTDKLKLQERLSTLLKASEGLEKALRSIEQDRSMGDCQASTSYVYEYENIARKALADFRAVKGERT